MAYKEYTKDQLIKKFGKGNKQIQVYKKYDYCNQEYTYEVRSVKNKPHENHQTVWEVLTGGICWTKDEYDDYVHIQKYKNAYEKGGSIMIQYQDKTVTAKTFAKHKISDRLMEVFDNPQLHLGPEFQNFTMKEQEEILRHVSLFEERVHRTLGVKFKEIISASNFTKVV